MADFTMKANDTRPAIQATLSAAATDVISSVKFLMSDSTGTLKVNAAGSIVTQPSSTSGGVVKYQWVANDVNTAGNYRGEFQVTFNDSRIETYPNSAYIAISILPDLG